MDLLTIALLGWLASVVVPIALVRSAARADELRRSVLKRGRGSFLEVALEPLDDLRSPTGTPFFATSSDRPRLADALHELRHDLGIFRSGVAARR